MIISWVAFVLAMVMLYRLAPTHLPSVAAERVVMYAAAFPFACFYGVVYSEATFLLFTVTAFYGFRTKRWWLGAAAGELASATRVNGILALPALALLAWQSAGTDWSLRKRAMAAVALVPAGLVLYSMYVDTLSGSYLEWSYSIQRWNYGIAGSPIKGFVFIATQLATRPYEYLTTNPLAPYDVLHALTALWFIGSLRRALLHQPIDRLPTQINYTAAMGQKLAAHFDVAVADLPHVLDNHFMRVDLAFPARLSADSKVRFDWWGAGRDTAEEGYYIPVNPLKDSKDLEAFPWPDPRDPHLLDEAARGIQAHGGEYFVAHNFGFALFERAWSLRGFEQIFIDLGRDQDFVGALLDRITAIQLVLIQRFIDLGVDGGSFGDDYGAQKNLLFSPAQWRKLIKPRLPRLFAPFVERGLPVIKHSDGQIQKILPDLVEIGLTTLNPVQPEVLDHRWLLPMALQRSRSGSEADGPRRSWLCQPLVSIGRANGPRGWVGGGDDHSPDQRARLHGHKIRGDF